MKLDQNYSFQNSFQTLPPFLFEKVKPTPIRNQKLIHMTKMKGKLGLSSLTDEEVARWLNGEISLEGEQRISTRYAGHQFGVWAGQLGDGRAISVGEILTPTNDRFEIQTKGSGLTPFSRMGDGKAVIRSSVREYLCSEAMASLGIPTTRVLALLIGDDKVRRETIERSALVARVFPSNLRFGHFEMCFHYQHKDELIALADYARSTFFNNASIEDMLKEVVHSTAKLLAKWQAVGFCHGVMNTDNMSLLGLTIDYGPFGFLEDTNLSFICNHTDVPGRYSYNQQPQVAMWNLERLCVCFLEIVPRERLEAILNEYPGLFEEEYARLAREKLGLVSYQVTDIALYLDLMQTLSTLSVDHTFFFRQLSRYKRGDSHAVKEVWDYYGNREELKKWFSKYDERLKSEIETDEARSQRMLKINPKYILRNYIAQEVIDEVEKGINTKLTKWLDVLYAPFDEHEEFDSYSRPTPPEFKHFEVSCSS